MTDSLTTRDETRRQGHPFIIPSIHHTMYSSIDASSIDASTIIIIIIMWL